MKLDKPGIVYIQNLVSDLKPDTRYRISFFMKTESVVPSGVKRGAFLRVSARTGETAFVNQFLPLQGIVGTKGWFRQNFEFKTSPAPWHKNVYVAPSLIYASGTVWFDDIRLEEIKDER